MISLIFLWFSSVSLTSGVTLLLPSLDRLGVSFTLLLSSLWRWNLSHSFGALPLSNVSICVSKFPSKKYCIQQLLEWLRFQPLSIQNIFWFPLWLLWSTDSLEVCFLFPNNWGCPRYQLLILNLILLCSLRQHSLCYFTSRNIDTCSEVNIWSGGECFSCTWKHRVFCRCWVSCWLSTGSGWLIAVQMAYASSDQGHSHSVGC